MKKHFTALWRSSSKNKSAGYHRRLSFFLWVRDRALKNFHQRGGLAITIGASLVPVAAEAATFTVDTLSDVDTAGLTLREAIAASNATSETNLINFDPSLAGGTLTLTQGMIRVNSGSDLTIEGPEDRITVSGGNQDGILEVFPSDVRISNLKLTNGNTFEGGAIFVSESFLTLTNCEISNNVGSEFGGGIGGYFSDLRLTNCTIDNNRAGGSGGGINLELTSLTLTDCTLSNNSAGGSGGGLYTSGITNFKPSLSLTNCEITDNTVNGTNDVRANGSGV